MCYACAYIENISTSLSTISTEIISDSCGVPGANTPIKSKADTQTVSRIVGGSIVNPHSIPWQVGLFVNRG